MNKSKLTPQDGDLFAMIREITKVDIVVNEKPGNYEIHVCVEDLPKETTEALTAAVAGRLGKRFISNETDGTEITYFCQYGDWKNYPEEIRTDEMPITPVPGTRYCRTLKEVDAIKVDREHLEDLQKFTGGGTMTIPRTPGAIAKYEFKDNHGIILTATEFSYIVREESGKIYVMDYREFIRDFELKYNPDDFEQCENCETRLPYENMLHDGDGVPLCPECMEALKGNPDFELVGVIKIMEERKSQIYDHGFDNDHDRNVNGNGQLKLVVASLLANDSGMFVRQTNWHFDWFKKIKAKTEIEQLAICGAMIAAEIDRLESERLLNPEGWQIADKSFNRYPDGTKAKGDAGEMWVKVPGGWKDEKTGKVDPHLGANWTGELLIPSKMNEEHKPEWIYTYRKKPVVIEAFKYGIEPRPNWFDDAVTQNRIKTFVGTNLRVKEDYYCEIETLEGKMIGRCEDYIIKGINGEIYPCKPDIFQKTYDPINEIKK